MIAAENRPCTMHDNLRSPPARPTMTLTRGTSLLLNIGHAIDHMFLLIFATAVASVAAEFGYARWEDLLPFSAGAFLMFGLGSVPAGRLGDLWGRRSMMVVFFFGMGASALLCALTIANRVRKALLETAGKA